MGVSEMTLPDRTEKQIKDLMKQYGWQKWEVIVHSVEREHQEMKALRSMIKESAKGNKNETRRRGM